MRALVAAALFPTLLAACAEIPKEAAPSPSAPSTPSAPTYRKLGPDQRTIASNHIALGRALVDAFRKRACEETVEEKLAQAAKVVAALEPDRDGYWTCLAESSYAAAQAAVAAAYVPAQLHRIPPIPAADAVEEQRREKERLATLGSDLRQHLEDPRLRGVLVSMAESNRLFNQQKRDRREFRKALEAGDEVALLLGVAALQRDLSEALWFYALEDGFASAEGVGRFRFADDARETAIRVRGSSPVLAYLAAAAFDERDLLNVMYLFYAGELDRQGRRDDLRRQAATDHANAVRMDQLLSDVPEPRAAPGGSEDGFRALAEGSSIVRGLGERAAALLGMAIDPTNPFSGCRTEGKGEPTTDPGSR
jgi:hypothetical protein